MCECIKKRIEKMKNNQELLKGTKNWKEISPMFKHTTEFPFVSPLNIPVVINGINSKGNKAKKELYYHCSFCPFCGEQWNEPDKV
ncbi:hypothetical protein HZI73_22430 [Vallitalea pronyensis]|uniref:Uncharacterized protein n=1 Tax=Vallitalea pronyensis TaxID=1348613 RepID=A0A8J8MMZ5_9FIRM|nr:hypothetical protein [Vallitalea pronyensis]QUI24887.1 hypothetical protein HZI73_22430 [Vallitalea pronyensis]